MSEPFDIQTNPKRHGCLSAFLIFAMIVNPIAAVSNFFFGSTIVNTLPNASIWAVYFLALSGAANFVFLLAIWKWKKWGLYGFTISGILVFVVNLTIGIPIPSSLLGLLGIATVLLFARPIWQHFE